MMMRLLLKPVEYLDPGTGSLIIQLILAGVLGISVAIKIFWKKIINLFKKNKEDDATNDFDDIDDYVSEDD